MKQITLKKVLSLVMLLSVVFLTTNCKTQKATATTSAQTTQDNDPNLVKRYCYGPDYFSNSEYIRASGTGTSSSQDMADQKALSSARKKMSASLETLVKTVNEVYARSMTKDGVEDLSEDYQTMTYEVIKQTLKGVVTICNKMTEKDNKYTSFVALQLSGEELLTAIGSRLSKDDKTQINFDKHLYKKVFDKQMDDYEESNN